MMASTLLLDAVLWDLVLDANGNIAVADEPYSLAQDAASAIKTFLGECYWDTTVGVPYLQRIFGKSPPLNYIKTQMVSAAETVPGVLSAQVFIISLTNRVLKAQVQVTPEAPGLGVQAATFNVINP
jgi:hypothetical protein